MSETDAETERLENTLIQCLECGYHCTTPEQSLTPTGHAYIDCPECGEDTFITVRDMCHHGRTLRADGRSCWKKAEDTLETTGMATGNSQTHHLCEHHYEEYQHMFESGMIY